MQADHQLSKFLKDAIDPMLKTGQDKVLLLSCIDLRYPHRIIDTMDGLGYRGKYYHLAMAGASHAAKHDALWTQTFADHLGFGVTHGDVTGIIIIDHMDCKAFELYEHVRPGGEEERQRHRDVARLVVGNIVKAQPSLAGNVHALLLPKELPAPAPEPIAHG